MAGTAVMGKPTEVKGDSLSGFAPDLSSQQLQEFLAGPLANAALLLGQATTRIVYDLDRYRAAQQPAFAATLARETHVSDPLPSSGLKVQLRFVYSNGFGREAQTKVQAEPGPLDLADPNSQVADPRWVGTGEKVCNNKGKPVRQAASAEGAAFRAGGRTPWLQAGGQAGRGLSPATATESGAGQASPRRTAMRRLACRPRAEAIMRRL